MKKSDYTLGVLGGMGTFATIHLFQDYAQVFPATKEWDRPRIIIDNRCTMPSRVRAILYNENRKELIDQMSDSIAFLIKGGADQIILACNTSHVFLNDVYRRVPEASGKVINIIDICVSNLKSAGIQSVFLLASEGTIMSEVYNQKLEIAGIRCEVPNESDFSKLRTCIEAVKQNLYSPDVMEIFQELLNCGNADAYVLGCTELPILYERYRDSIKSNLSSERIYDPLHLALLEAHNTYMNCLV